MKVSADKATNSIVVTSSPARLRGAAQRHRPARPAAPPGVHRSGHHGPHDRPLEPARRRTSTRGDTSRSAPRRQALVYGGLNPLEDDRPPEPDGLALSAFALGVRGPGIPGTENLLGTGISIPAFGVLINALAQHRRHRRPLDAAHPRDRQHPGRDQRRPEHPAADERRRRLGSLAGAGGAAARRARSAALGALGFGGGSAPRRARTSAPRSRSPAPQRLGRGAPRAHRGDQRRRAASSRSARSAPCRSRSAPRRRSSSCSDQQTVVIGGLMRNRIARTRRRRSRSSATSPCSARSSGRRSNDAAEVEPHPRPDAVHHPRAGGPADGLRAQDAGAAGVPRPLLRLQRGARSTSRRRTTRARTASSRTSARRTSDVEEQRRLDELTRPREMKTHEPGQPLEMPALGSASGAEQAPARQGGRPPRRPRRPPSRRSRRRLRSTSTPPARSVEKHREVGDEPSSASSARSSRGAAS